MICLYSVKYPEGPLQVGIFESYDEINSRGLVAFGVRFDTQNYCVSVVLEIIMIFFKCKSIAFDEMLQHRLLLHLM